MSHVLSTTVDHREQQLRALYDRLGTNDLLEIVKLRGLYIRQNDSYAFVTCPWAHEHTTPDGERDAALHLTNGTVDGFECFHGHCKERKLPDVLRHFGLTQHTTDTYERLLKRAVENERAHREARRIVNAEERGQISQPEVNRLDELLATPDVQPTWRISGWLPVAARVVVSAQFKAGKTILAANVARSLIDGDQFLGVFDVTPVSGSVAVIDLEMSKPQLTGWYRDQGIKGTDRIWLITLRGRAAAFDILDEQVRARWVALFASRQVEFLILDCLRPVLDGLGLDENRDAGKFFVALDALLDKAGISECLVVHHMGHTGERARGDSRLRDWPDAEWRLVRQDDDPASDRFITAYGRDVDVPEQQLGYDPTTRRLTVVGGSRRDVKTSGALPLVLDFIGKATEPPSLRDILRGLKGGEHSDKALRAAIKLAISNGQVTVEPGPRGSQLHRLADGPMQGQVPMFEEQRGPDTRVEL